MRTLAFLESLGAVVVIGLLSGCAMEQDQALGVQPQAFVVNGKVMGGNLPIGGSHIYVFAANYGTWAGPGIAASAGNASKSLLTNVSGVTTADANGNYYVTTQANGGFDLGASFPGCNTYQGAYIYAVGGNSMGGSVSGSGPLDGNNANIGLLMDLGMCSSIASNQYVVVNEMSTVAAAYALAGMASDSTHISGDAFMPGGNTTRIAAQAGYANAFGNAANLVKAGAALTTTPGSNSLVTGTVPTATLNTIADIVASCVQSTGYAGTGDCADLFAFTGTASTADTATATIRLAQNPVGINGSGVTIAKLYGDMASQQPFQPVLASAPHDFLVAIRYGGSGLNGAWGIAADQAGSLWVGTNNTAVTQLYGTGAAYSASTFAVSSANSQTESLAIDSSGNVWATGEGGTKSATVDKLSGSGTSYTDSQISLQGYLFYVQANVLAFDTSGDLWAVTAHGYAYETSSPGSQNIQTTYQPGGNSGTLEGVAVDASGTVWTGGTSLALSSLTRGSSGTYTITVYNGPVNFTQGLAVGADGSIWMVDNGANSMLRFTPGNTTSNVSTGTVAGLNAPYVVAVDGAGNLWVANQGVSAISELTSAGVAVSPSTGYTGTSGTAGGSSGPLTTGLNGIAVDGSGNVWVGNNGNGSVEEFVGAGVPVMTPLVSAANYNKIGQRP